MTKSGSKQTGQTQVDKQTDKIKSNATPQTFDKSNGQIKFPVGRKINAVGALLHLRLHEFNSIAGGVRVRKRPRREWSGGGCGAKCSAGNHHRFSNKISVLAKARKKSRREREQCREMTLDRSRLRPESASREHARRQAPAWLPDAGTKSF